MLRVTNEKNIAIFCGSLYRGGAEHVTIYLACGLKKLGYQTEIITCSQKENEYEMPKGIKRHILGNSSMSKVTMIKKMRKILQKDRIDILLVISTPLCIYAIPAATGLSIKVIVSERNDPTHFAGKKITQLLANMLVRRADGFVFQTHDAKDYYKKMTKGKGEVIYNPIFTDGLPLPYTKTPEKIIVAVGRLDRQKNHALLIRAFAECEEINREYRLVIYGEGLLRQELEELVKSYGMKGRIVLPGNVPDVYNRIRKASLYVLPSNFEGMPNALIEAMALGLPCISTDCPIGGPSELIEDGVNGILIPVGDKEKLIEKMREVLSMPGPSRKMGEVAFELRGKLEENLILGRWAEYIERIIAE